jgi:hypothetical protein
VAYSGRVTVTPPGGETSAASVDVSDDAVVISPERQQTVVLAYVDIEDVHDDDYTLRLTDYTGRRYDLTMLGKAYGQVLAEVRKRRDDALGHNLLLTGVNLQDSFPGKLFGGEAPMPVEIRLFEDAMVVVPQRGTMFGVPFAYVEDVAFDAELYQTHVRVDEGTAYVFGQLGKRSEELPREIRRLVDAATARTAKSLAALLPGAAPGAISALASLMRDGRIVQQRAVDAIDPGLWPRLESVVVATPDLRETFDRLKSMCPQGWGALGIKEVLSETEGMTMAEQLRREPQPAAAEAEAPTTEEAAEGTTEEPPETPTTEEPVEGAQERAPTMLWYFTPLADGDGPMNAVAQEITNEGGHATYVFRLMEAERFASLSGDALADAVAAGIARLNRALLTLNFRREPIYLPQEELSGGRWGSYAVALRYLDYLRWARAAFLGRAIHNSTWERQLREAASRA